MKDAMGGPGHHEDLGILPVIRTIDTLLRRAQTDDKDSNLSPLPKRPTRTRTAFLQNEMCLTDLRRIPPNSRAGVVWCWASTLRYPWITPRSRPEP